MHRTLRLVIASCLAFVAGIVIAAEEPAYQPTVGQAGKDVVWVPTPAVTVEKMLDMAKVTPQDFVMDLGSGDGRNVIAAARRGAQALGVEYNPELVALSQQAAAREGVADKARFVQGDMYEADISGATVLALFLLTENLDKLAPKFLELRPGTRIVSNGFTISGWKADEVGAAEGDCDYWCTAYLYIVPAKIAGAWQFPRGTLLLEQKFQMVSGTLDANGTLLPVTNGRLLGDRVSFTVDGIEYTGRVDGGRMTGEGRGRGGKWSAVRAR